MTTFRCVGCGAFNHVHDDSRGRTPICGRCKQRLQMDGTPQEVDGAALSAALHASPIPVLVDFWAPWCGPCRMAAPILDQAARLHAGELVVLKVNSDVNPRASAEHHVEGIPAFLLFKNGRETARQVGLLPEPAFKSWIAEHVS